MISEPYKLYTSYEVNPSTGTIDYVTIPDSTIKVETFSNLTLGITIIPQYNDLYVELSNDGITYGPKIKLRSGNSELGDDVLSTSFQCKSIRLTNVNTSGSYNAQYQVIGWM